MKAMLLRRIVSLDETDTPLELAEVPAPEPAAGEVLIRIAVCGVCHTELDEIEGRTSPPVLPVIPGHQIVGRVEKLGAGVTRHGLGDRVGVGWIYCSSGQANENLSPQFRATGRDVDGGYAELICVPEDYAYAIPEFFSDVQAAPLLCAGAIGYRALRLCGIRDGDPLGLTGFGGSAHLMLPVAKHLYPNTPVFVFARNHAAQRFARELGADWAGDTTQRAPQPLQAIIDTTPAWTPVVAALSNLRPGGRLVVNAIRKEERDKEVLLGLSYDEHLWMEREVKSVANITGNDIREFLAIAAAVPLRPVVQTYHLAEANQALLELKRGSVRGAKVLRID